MANISILTLSCMLIYLNCLRITLADECPKYSPQSDFDMKKVNKFYFIFKVESKSKNAQFLN